jgi:peptide/nickel transport system ATP-binding protein
MDITMDVPPPDDRALLSVRDLHTTFNTPDGPVRAVDGVSFDIDRGEVFSIVGESGSGKSVTAMSIVGLLPRTAKIEADGLLWKGRDILGAGEAEMRRIRGGEIAMIFQDPLTALNPVQTVGKQIGEMVRVHESASRKVARARAVETLGLVGIPRAAERVDSYPHEFSGGMRQRAMIAMAIACNPDLLIADEPTTALDVTVQAQVLEVLLGIKDEIDSAIMLITHDLGVVAGMADRVMVMYAGRASEARHRRRDLLPYAAPVHPRASRLAAAGRRVRGRAAAADPGTAPVAPEPPDRLPVPPPLPLRPPRPVRRRGPGPPRRRPGWSPLRLPLRRGARLDRRGRPAHRVGDHVSTSATFDPPVPEGAAATAGSEPILEARHLVKHFPVRGGVLQREVATVQAVSDVSLTLGRGETLGLVGESGCGKSTTGRLLLNLVKPTSGSVLFEGRDVTKLTGGDMRAVRQRLQIVFQDPYASLNPRITVGAALSEPLRVHGRWESSAGRSGSPELLRVVGLAPEHANRYPHEFSGGSASGSDRPGAGARAVR